MKEPVYEESRRLMEDGLSFAEILNDFQKENIRLKAEDLWNRRLIWESVPFRILFEFNPWCNAKCVHCHIDHSPKDELTPAVLEALLEEIGWGVTEIMPLLRGEPTLAPLHEIAPMLRRYNHYLNLITNGLLFTRSYHAPIADIMSRVQFSLHTHRRDLFKHITPKLDYDVVVQNIRDAVEVAEETGAHILTCICPMLDMLDYMEEYVTFVAGLGVKRIVIQKLFPQTLKYRELDPFIVRDMEDVTLIWRKVLETARKLDVFIESNFIEFFKDENNPTTQSKLDILQDNAHICELFYPGFCISTAINVVVEYDGTVIPCVNDRIVLGSLRESSFSDIWNGEPMQELRRSHFERKLRPNCDTCKDFHNFD